MFDLDNKTINLVSGSIKNGEIGVLPTDTVYGVVCSAMKKKSVEMVYKLRKRNLKKPMLILIGSISDLKLFNVKINNDEKKRLKKLWPGEVSVILKCDSKKFEYLHRGKKTLGFRLPKNESLIKLVKRSGPIIAPSANFEGEKTAETINEAKKYFKERIDFYVDVGKLRSAPSTIVVLDKDEPKILRQGARKLV
ncbi:MAG: L-threonylcarbamoyladenylate synthase [Candidatus Paceibacterota bacterium]